MQNDAPVRHWHCYGDRQHWLVNKETPLLTWRPGRGYSRYMFEKRFRKWVPLMHVIGFGFFGGGYFLVRYSMFFGDDWFHWWDYPAGVAFGVIADVLYVKLLFFLGRMSGGDEVKLFADRVETEISVGEDGTMMLVSRFSDMLSCVVTDIRQEPYRFLLVEIELKPDLQGSRAYNLRLPRFGIPSEVDSGPILRAFEQNGVGVTRNQPSDKLH